MTGVKVSDYIVPMGLSDTYPTNLDIYGKGGIHSVTSLAERDAITLERRSQGMFSYVQDSQTMYVLSGGIQNINWNEVYNITDSTNITDIRLDIISIRRDLDRVKPLYKLPYNQIWIGDSEDKAVAQSTINIDNLPTLGVTSVPNPFTLGFVGQVWEGSSSGRPEPSSIVGEIFADIIAINARFLTSDFILGHAPVQAVWPGAQFLENLQDGMLKHTGKTLQYATPNVDYLSGISQEAIYDQVNLLTYGNNKVYSCPITYMLDPGNNGLLNANSMTISALNFAAKRFNGIAASVTVEGNVYVAETVGARRLILYDAKEELGRRQDGVTLEGPIPLPNGTMLKWIMPSVISTAQQVLSDIGSNAAGDRLLGFTNIIPPNLLNNILAKGVDPNTNLPIFVNATLAQGYVWQGNADNMPAAVQLNLAPTDATYILQTASNSLPNAQVLSNLGMGLIKVNAGGVLALAIGGVDFATVASVTAAQATADAASAAAAAAPAAGAALAATYFNAQMLPYSAVPGVTAGLSISAALAVVTAAAASAQSTASSALNKINSLKIRGDVIGDYDTNTGAVNTTFKSDPVFTGNSMTIPIGSTAQRPMNPSVGMIRCNTDL